MPCVSIAGGLADFIGLTVRGTDEPLQGFLCEMRLIAQNQCPVGQRSIPRWPLRGAKNGAEHPAGRVGIEYAVFSGQLNAIEFGLDRDIKPLADHGHLLRTEVGPGFHEMTEDG
jgi:hypothetical protein